MMHGDGATFLHIPPSVSTMNKLPWVLLVVASAILVEFTAAFSVAPAHTQQAYNTRLTRRRPNKTIPSRGSALNTSNSNYDSDPTSGLTNTLARLDQQWKIQQSNKPRSRWTQIFLNEEKDEKEDDGSASSSGDSTEFDFASLASPATAAADSVYLLEPPNLSTPSCLIVFVGGAGLGQYPHIAYNELLLRISDKLNAAVVAAPFPIGLDHFSLAKRVGELSRKAVIQCEDDVQRLYPSNLPTYCLCHSLGCKLMSIYLAATEQDFEGIGFMSFNNFGFADTIGMAKSFAETMGMSGTGSSQSSTDRMLEQVLNFAATTVSAIGLEFTPSPMDTNRLIRLKFDSDRQAKTRLFSFDDDTLENSFDFVKACEGKGPSVSGLPGTHLTPVFFKLGLDDLPNEARDLAREATRGVESASFGNEGELNDLVNEIVSWIKGKPPSRAPKWGVEQAKLAAGSMDG